MRGKARSWRARALEARRRAHAADDLNDRWGKELALADGAVPYVETPAGEVLRGPGQEARPCDALGHWKRTWYADGRARTLALGRSDIVATCGLRKMLLRCACGPSVKDIGCGQIQLCDRCRRPYYRRIRKRALRAIDARMRDAHLAWAADGYRHGGKPGIVLLTLTCPKVVDGVELSLADRHRLLVDGWRRLRTWLHGRCTNAAVKAWRDGGKVGVKPDAGIGQFAYVGLPELSAKEDARGHLHYHVICVWPWWDWSEAIGEWRRATGVSGAIAPDMRAVHSVKRAAHYVGKYATKGASANAPGMTAPLVGEFVATYYGKRRVLPSVGFWEPRDPPVCPCCAQPLVVTDRPPPCADAAAVWRAMVELRGARPPPAPSEWLQCAPAW